MNDLRKFNEILRKDVAYNKVKSHKRAGFHALFGRYFFGKTTGGGGSN